MCVKCVEGVGILSQPAARLDPPLAATRVARPPFALALLQLHTLRAYRKRYEAVLPQLADLSGKVDAIRAWATGRVAAATTTSTSSTTLTVTHGGGGGVTSAGALQQPGPPSLLSVSSSELLAEAVSGLASAMEERVRRSAQGGVSVGSGGGRGEGVPLALLSNTSGSSSGGGGGDSGGGSGGGDGNNILSLGLMTGIEAVRQAVRHLLQASPQQALTALAEVRGGGQCISGLV